MKINNDDIETIKHDMIDMTKRLIIHGHIDSGYENKRKQKVVSKVGVDVATKIVEALFAQLNAFDKDTKG